MRKQAHAHIDLGYKVTKNISHLQIFGDFFQLIRRFFCIYHFFFVSLQPNYIKIMRTQEELQGVSLLGNKRATIPTTYAPEILEAFVNKHPDNEYLVTFHCPEFTTLCPLTGQPDYATIVISYIPREKMVESKSLKLYLFSFRNHGDFHEDCVNIIMKDLIRLMDPKYIEVTGLFTPRGGIRIYPFANYADADHQQLREQRLREQCSTVLKME